MEQAKQNKSIYSATTAEEVRTYINSENANTIWARSYLNYEELSKWDTEEGEEEENHFIFDSEWLERITWRKLAKSKDYVVIIFFDPSATKCHKWPFGFGPLVFGDIKKSDIEKIILAPSHGRHYLDHWAFGNKAPLGIADDFLGKLGTEIMEAEQIEDKGKGEKSELDTVEADLLAQMEKEERDERAKRRRAALRDYKKMYAWSKMEIEKLNFLKHEGIATKRLLLMGFKDLQWMFGVSFSKRILFNSLSGISGGAFNPAHWNKMKYAYKNFNSLLEGEGIRSKATMQRIINAKNPFLRKLRPLYKSKEAIKDLRNAHRVSLEGKAQIQFLEDNKHKLVKLEKGSVKNLKGDFFKVSEYNVGKIEKGKYYMWKDELEVIKKNAFFKNGAFNRFDINRASETLGTTGQNIFRTKKGISARRVSKNVINIGISFRMTQRGRKKTKKNKKIKHIIPFGRK